MILAISELGLGGTERQLVELASRLGTPFEVRVVALYGGGPLVATLQGRGIPVSVLGTTARRFGRVLSAVRAIARLYALLRHDRPDVFHGFLSGAYIPGALVARLAGVPAVVASRRSLGHYKARNPLLLTSERLATSATDLVLPNSQAVLEDVRGQERVPLEKLRVVWNAVEPPVARLPRARVRAACRVPAGATCGVVVANLIPYKGHAHLMRAMPAVRAVCGDVHLLLVGDGPERARLEDLASELGVADLVHFCGASEDVGSYVHAADFGVLPSLEEGLSNALLEMMAAGLPAVATAVGGNIDVVRDGTNGLLVPPADPERLAAAIARLVRDPDLRSRLGTAARADVAERFSYAALVSSMAAIYRELAGRGRRR